MIIPTLPALAMDNVRAWNARGGRAVRRIVSRSRDGDCPNCGGLRVVIVSLLSDGPSHTPVTIKKPSAFVDGGWWVVEDSREYPCPVCSGRVVVRDAPQVRKETAAKTQAVTKRLEQTDRRAPESLPAPRGSE